MARDDRARRWLPTGLVIAALVGIGSDASPLRAEVGRPAQPLRKLAAGVETTIPADLQPEETSLARDLIEVRSYPDLKWTPAFSSASQTLFEMAAGTRFHRSVWGLELSFKPLRMMYVDVPQPSGKMQRKLIWYMVYRVKNKGERLIPSETGDGSSNLVRNEEPIKFRPLFVLESHEYQKSYLDRVIPSAIAAIQQREDPGRPLLSSVEMGQHPIPVSTERTDRSVWGVVTWEDVDPRIDFLSVFVLGLSNAYRWVDPPGDFQVGDPPAKGRRFAYKTLQLNFWRPGDQYDQHEEEIRFGTPKGKADRYGVEEGVDYAWVYR